MFVEHTARQPGRFCRGRDPCPVPLSCLLLILTALIHPSNRRPYFVSTSFPPSIPAGRAKSKGPHHVRSHISPHFPTISIRSTGRGLSRSLCGDGKRRNSGEERNLQAWPKIGERLLEWDRMQLAKMLFISCHCQPSDEKHFGWFGVSRE